MCSYLIVFIGLERLKIITKGWKGPSKIESINRISKVIGMDMIMKMEIMVVVKIVKI